MATIELTDSEYKRLRALVAQELDAIKRYERDTLDMHEGLHALYRATRSDLKSVARKLERTTAS
jgi:hypothetical protein